MAKATRPAASIDQTTKDLMETCAQEIITALGDQFFEVDGTPMATVKYPDKQFKKKPLIAGWNFSLAYAYVGTRNKIIFGLSPEDAQEYEFVEMEAKDLDNAFPMIGPAVAPLYGLEGEKMYVIFDEILAKRAQEIVAQREADKAAAESNYQENDNFGQF